MAEQDVANHTLELLKRLNAKMDSFSLEFGDVKLRLSAMEDHLAGVAVSVAGITHRLDRVEGRLDRMERRLELRSGDE